VDNCVLMKVQFMGTSTVTTVLTQGKSNGSYMTQYRLEISLDCATFQPILDGSGNNKVCCVTSKRTPFLIIISNAFRFVAVLSNVTDLVINTTEIFFKLLFSVPYSNCKQILKTVENRLIVFANK